MNSGNATRVVCTVAIAAALLAPLWYWNWGVIDREATQFIPHYLADRGLAWKVFDPAATEFGDYQARELSYVIDDVDAHAFRFMLKAGLPMLAPLSALAGGVLTALIVWRVAQHYPRLGLLTATLCLLVYFTNYVYLVTAGTFYRSAKPILVPVLLATVFFVLRLRQSARERPTARSLGVVFVLFCAMGLLDPQGVFLAVVGLALLVLGARRETRDARIAPAAAAAGVVLLFYNVVLAPWLISRLNGYAPSFEYQMLPIGELARSWRPWLQAGKLLLNTYGVLAGGVPYWAAAILLAAMAAWTAQQRAWPIVRTLTLVIVAQVALFAIMIVRYPPVYTHADHRLWYYPMPAQAVALAGLLLLSERWVADGPPWRTVAVRVALVLCIAGNVLQWPAHWREMQRAYAFPLDYQQSVLLKAAVRDGHTDPAQRPEYVELYRYLATSGAAPRTPASGSSGPSDK